MVELATHRSPLPQTLPDAPQDPRHFAFVDSLRGLAILGVIALHATFKVPTLPVVLTHVAVGGQYGVQLFFVISSCTLFWSLQSRRASDLRPTVAFFVRRAFRIAPLFWTATLAYLYLRPPATPTLFAPFGIHVGQVVSTLLFVHIWYPTSINSVVPGGWSIGVEATFYLMIPLLFRLLRSARPAAWCLVVLGVAVRLLSPAARAACRRLFPHLSPDLLDAAVYYSFPSQLPVFFCGILAYFALRDGIAHTVRTARTPLLVLVILLGFNVLPDHVTAGIAFLGLVCLLTPTASGWIVNRLTQYLGTVSYSVYIWHFAVLDLFTPERLARLTPPYLPHMMSGLYQFGLLMGTAVPLSLAAASASFYVVERPGIRLGRIVLRRTRSVGPSRR